MNPFDLRDRIKSNALQSRQYRDEARATCGQARYDLQMKARNLGGDTRLLHLAYGLLRGMTIEQIESPNTTTPLWGWRTVLKTVQDYYWESPRKEQTQEDFDAEKAARLAQVEKDLIQWQNTIWKRILTLQVERKLAS